MNHHLPLLATVILAILTFIGCGEPKPTAEELGKIHTQVPRLKGDDQPVIFPRPVNQGTEAAAQPTGELTAAILESGAITTQPGVEPSGTTLPAAQATGATPGVVLPPILHGPSHRPAVQSTAANPAVQGTR